MKPRNLLLCYSCVNAIKDNVKVTDLFRHKENTKCEMCSKKNFVVNLYRLEDFTDEDDRERGS